MTACNGVRKTVIENFPRSSTSSLWFQAGSATLCVGVQEAVSSFKNRVFDVNVHTCACCPYEYQKPRDGTAPLPLLAL